MIITPATDCRADKLRSSVGSQKTCVNWKVRQTTGVRRGQRGHQVSKKGRGGVDESGDSLGKPREVRPD